MGWGNVALCLCDLVYREENPKVFKSIHDVDRGVIFSGFEITDKEDDERFEPRLYINPFFFHKIHVKLPEIIKPNEELRKLIDEHLRLLPCDMKYGMHIRRGACSEDSRDMGCHGLDENGNIKRAYFAKDSAMEKFIKIIENTDGKIFLASDSSETKKMLQTRFPDKICTVDNDIALSYDCIYLKNKNVSKSARYACYLDWFLLSKCRKIYITAGNQDLSDLSTFGYSAGVYGRSEIEFVFN